MSLTNPYANQYAPYLNYPYQTAPAPSSMTYQPVQAASQYGNGSLMTVLVEREDDVSDYPVAAGTTVMLIGFKLGKFWLKSTANNGVPQPLREFTFSELAQTQNIQNDQVSRAEFTALSEKIDKLLKDLGGEA